MGQSVRTKMKTRARTWEVNGSRAFPVRSSTESAPVPAASAAATKTPHRATAPGDLQQVIPMRLHDRGRKVHKTAPAAGINQAPDRAAGHGIPRGVAEERQ